MCYLTLKCEVLLVWISLMQSSDHALADNGLSYLTLKYVVLLIWLSAIQTSLSYARSGAPHTQVTDEKAPAV